MRSHPSRWFRALLITAGCFALLATHPSYADAERTIIFSPTITVKEPQSSDPPLRVKMTGAVSKISRVAIRPRASMSPAAEKKQPPIDQPVALIAAESIPVDLEAPFSVMTSTLGERSIEIQGPILCNDQVLGPLPNSDVFVDLIPMEKTGGHDHESSPSDRPVNQFIPSSGNTGPSGFDYVISYVTPEPSGVIIAAITCMPPDGFPIFAAFTIGIRMTGLQELAADPNYALVGTTSVVGMRHPENHFGDAALVNSIRTLASDYSEEFPGSRLRINDMSLEEGGLFDLKGDWFRPHKSHRFGVDADIGLVPSSRVPTLMMMSEVVGFSLFLPEPSPEQPNHYHLRVR